ncbi:SDR family oxidoreductase [Pseudonocardiaceae bacterium YIM PH 21723]|nr:SDR family oxidoreductase [Pseudonocardiaceae bacterium YIM PH 21723]
MRTVVITGGSRGIGAAIAERFRAAGDRVHALSSRELDVTDEGRVVEYFAELGPVDVLVNNAGVAASAPLHRTTLDSWQRLHDINATGSFLCARAVLPEMRERGTGRIITVASVASLGGAKYIAAYAASKHAVLGLTRAIAAEVAGTGITANSVCPGYVRTDMTAASIANMVAKTGRSAEEAERFLADGQPLGRLVEPAEVAHAVAFFASPEAGAINGQSLVLDGGGLQQ